MSLLRANLTVAYVYSICHTIKAKVTNEKEALEAYDDLIRSRHDLLHYCVSEMFDIPISEEKELKWYFPNIDHPDMMKTPDIVLKLKDEILICDVTVTTRFLDSLKSKQDKYNLVGSFIQAKTSLPVHCLHFIYDQLNPDINGQCFRLRRYITKEFNYHLFETSLEIITSSINTVCTRISKESLEFHKRLKYSMNIEIGEKVFASDFDIQETVMDEIILDKYPFDYDDSKEFINDLPEMLKEILEDDLDPINAKYRDVKNESAIFIKIASVLKVNNNSFKLKVKPTHHALYPFYEEVFNLPKIKGPEAEQKMISNFLGMISPKKNVMENKYISFIQEIAEAYSLIWSNKQNRNCLCKGYFFDEQEKVKQKYKSFIEGKKTNLSFYEYLYDNSFIDKPKDSEEKLLRVHAKRQKVIQIPNGFFSQLSKQGLFKSGVSYWKNYDQKEEVKIRERTTTSFKDSTTIDIMVKVLSSDSQGSYYKTQLNDMNSSMKEVDAFSDETFVKNMKKELVKEYSVYTDQLFKTEAFNYLWFNHLFYTQLMHFMSLSLLPNNYYFFNCGIPNFLCICIGGFRDTDTESGKAFMTMILTEEPEKYSDSFFWYN